MIEKLTTSGAERKAKLKAGMEATNRRYSGVFARLADEIGEIAPSAPDCLTSILGRLTRSWAPTRMGCPIDSRLEHIRA